MLSVISIAFLFLVRMWFASILSGIQKVRICYGNDTVKFVRQLDNLAYKYHRLLLDLSTIENCVQDNYNPMFAQFHLENADLRDSSAYPKCLQTLLMQDIMIKRRCVTLVIKNVSSIRNIFVFRIKWVDFHRICNLSLNESFCEHQNI